MLYKNKIKIYATFEEKDFMKYNVKIRCSAGDRDFLTGFTLANEPLASILRAHPSLLRFIN